MGFIKMLIGLPLLVVILVFAFVNNDLAVFNLWPFYIEITVSLSVAIVFFYLFRFRSRRVVFLDVVCSGTQSIAFSTQTEQKTQQRAAEIG